MIEASEIRLGNYILHKTGVRILPVRCGFNHFEILSKGNSKEIFPMVLKADLLQRCGFIENKKYPLYPEAREFVLALPVIGSNKNEIYVYIKNNKECFGRATINGLPVTNNFYQVHQLQNLYYVLVGTELEVNL
ncbi:MAG TPA: hypothetical protein VM368_09380 [Flavisolibacter sp.]|nr:hypothetical protein [Flavisolibacter sp.]